MKVKLIRPASTLNPEWNRQEAARCKNAGKKYDVPHSIPVDAGTEIDHPDAWKLIRMGYAEPEDDEARERAGLSPEQIRQAIRGQDRIQEEFDKGVRKARKKKAKQEESSTEETQATE